MECYDMNIDYAALASLLIEGHQLNPDSRPIKDWDKAPIFVDKAPCTLTPLDAARKARSVLTSVSDDACIAALKTYWGPRGKHLTTQISPMAIATCRVLMAGPLLAFASGKFEPTLPGKFYVTKYADAQVAAALTRADDLIEALDG